ncbi:DUF805 domain-containing protein [Falsiroseomonas sp. HC035]|uniref:DUF805 domain-containing protein n=1 Tax=Falsiroseomonas sp. HC035 TaxID=3390999 RepID=UPI003D3213C2
MNFSQWLSTRGRITRTIWWRWYGFVFLGFGLVNGLVQRGHGMPSLLEALLGLVSLLLIPAAICGGAKRWHDRDCSGWWQLVVLIPVVGWLWNLIAVGAMPGNTGPNRFGPDPRETGGIAPPWGPPSVPLRRGTDASPRRNGGSVPPTGTG